MTEPVRSVAAVEARQGGFSTVALPAPVQYAGPIPEGPDELIVYWTESGPAATTGNVQWSIIVSGSEYATTTFQGQLAARLLIPGEGSGVIQHTGTFDEDVFSIGTEDFTYEWWGNPGGEGQNKNISGDLRSSSSDALSGLRGLFDPFNPFKWDQVIQISSPDGSLRLTEDIGFTPPGWAHVCIQRQGNLYIYHLDGQRIQFTEKNGTSPASDQNLSAVNMSGNLRVVIRYSGIKDNTTVAIGQTRITKGARYGTGNFTPPTGAFYTA
jgi:hypothetical protein